MRQPDFYVIDINLPCQVVVIPRRVESIITICIEAGVSAASFDACQIGQKVLDGARHVARLKVGRHAEELRVESLEWR